MTPALSFTVKGAPRSKKNHNQVVVVKGKPRVLPSEQWRRWEKTCAFRLADGSLKLHAPTWTGGPANVCAVFYLDANHHADPVGLYQGLADLLQKRGCVPDDYLFRSWDGSRVLVDRDNPRVEVTLTCAQEAAA